MWYIDYSKENAVKLLIKKTGWQYYGGHHLENRASSFSHTIWLPRYGIDFRYLSLAAKVRQKRLDQNKAIKIFNCELNGYGSTGISLWGSEKIIVKNFL